MHTTEDLFDLAEHILAVPPADPTTDPGAVLVVEHDELLIATPDTADRSVVDHLLGLTAPTAWTAIGIMSNGWAHRDTPPGRRSDRIRLVHLVGRDDAEVTVLSSTGRGRERLGQSGGGRVSDICRRVFDLATAPPPDDWSALDRLWLDRIMNLVLLRPDGPPPSWSDVERLRPGRLGSTPAAEWAELRHDAIVRVKATGAPGLEPAPFPPDLAAWMDDGMFARWWLSLVDDLDHLLFDLGDLLEDATHRQISHALVTRLAS